MRHGAIPDRIPNELLAAACADDLWTRRVAAGCAARPQLTGLRLIRVPDIRASLVKRHRKIYPEHLLSSLSERRRGSPRSLSSRKPWHFWIGQQSLYL